MKLLLENWKKLLEEGEIVDLPTGPTVADRYTSYVEHMDVALEELESIKGMFERDGFGLSEINYIIRLLTEARDDDTLRMDVESF